MVGTAHNYAEECCLPQNKNNTRFDCFSHYKLFNFACKCCHGHAPQLCFNHLTTNWMLPRHTHLPECLITSLLQHSNECRLLFHPGSQQCHTPSSLLSFSLDVFRAQPDHSALGQLVFQNSFILTTLACVIARTCMWEIFAECCYNRSQNYESGNMSHLPLILPPVCRQHFKISS